MTQPPSVPPEAVLFLLESGGEICYDETIDPAELVCPACEQSCVQDKED